MKIKIGQTFGMLLLLSGNLLCAQNNRADSLWNALQASKSDTVKQNLYYELSGEFEKTNPDSAIAILKRGLLVFEPSNIDDYYKQNQYKPIIAKEAMLARKIGIVNYKTRNYGEALIYFKMAADMYHQLGMRYESASCANNVALIHYINSDFANAVQEFEAVKQVFIELDKQKELASVYTNLGNLYQSQGNYTEALKAYQESITIKERENDTKGLALMYNNLGSLYYNRKQYQQALENHQKYLSVAFILADSNAMAQAFNNLALTYSAIEKSDTAQIYFKKAIGIFVGNNNYVDAAKAMNNLGEIFATKKRYQDALKLFKQSLEYRQKANAMNGAGITYSNMARIYFDQGNLSQSIAFAHKALSVSKESPSLKAESLALLILYKAHEQSGHYQKALSYFKQYTQTNDSLMGIEKQSEIERIESRFEMERIQQANEHQKFVISQRDTQIKAQEKEYRQERTVKNVFILAFLMVIGVVAWALHELIQRKKANRTLTEQTNELINTTHELSILNSEMFHQREQIEEQNVLLTQQKQALEKVNHNLEDSIQYAEYIQRAILPSTRKLRSFFSDSFVLYEPKNTVGGDFYWVQQVNDLIIIAVGDCTGHGVSGGFLSMLGISALKGIVITKKQTDPAQILSQLRTEIIESLHQTGELMEQADGIDLAIAVVDKTKNRLYYSGARANLVMVDKKQSTLIKGDRLSVSMHPKMKDFTTQTIPLTGTETLYFYTDGFVDQFNEQGQKFGRNAFMALCAEICTMPFAQQKEVLYQTLMTWKADFEQIDDVTVLGLKI